MKPLSLPWILVASFVLQAGTMGFAQEQAKTFSLDDSLSAVVIGDVKGLVAEISKTVDQVMPGMGGTIPFQIGAFAGDPDLAGFAEGAGIAAVAFPDRLFLVFAEISPDQREQYVAKAKELGMGSAVAADLAIFAEEDAGIETGKKVAAEVRDTLLKGNDEAGVNAFVHIPKILDTYQPQIDMGLGALTGLMKAGMAMSATGVSAEGIEGMVHLVQAEIFALYNLITQLDIFEVGLKPDEEGITLTLSFMPTPGTNLARFLAKAKPEESTSLMGMVPGKGTIRFEGQYEQEAFEKFSAGEIEALFDKLEWSEEDEKNLRSMIEDSVTLYGKGFAGSMLDPSEDLFSGVFIYDTESPDRAVEIVRDMLTHMESLGFLDFYGALGMEMKFEYKEAVEEHKGIPIHRIETISKIDEKVAKEAGDFLKMFTNLDYDLAVVEGYLVYSMGGSPIEEAIDAVLAGKAPSSAPLVSGERWKDRGLLYVDISIAGYLRLISGAMKSFPAGAKDKEADSVFSAIDSSLEIMADAPPVLLAILADPEVADLKIQVPAGLIQKISEATAGAMTSQEK